MTGAALIAVALAIVGCGSDDAPAAVSDSTLVDAGGEPVPTEITSPESTATTEASTTVVTTVPPTDPPITGVDPACLQGAWIMKQDTLDLLVATVVPVPGLGVSTGSLSMEFAGDAAVSKGQYTLKMTTADAEYEADVDTVSTGTFQVDGDLVLMNWAATEGGVSTARAITAEGTFEVPGAPLPELPPIADGPTECTDSTLTFTTTRTGANTIVMVFERATG